jgi:deaminated glutathione amidase
VRAAIYQMTSGIEPAANAALLVDAIGAARAQGADMLFAPEMSGQLDGDIERLRALATSEQDNPVLSAVREAARAAQLWVHLGSLPLRLADHGDRLANRSFVIDASGEVRARYDKIHLFDADVTTGDTWRESAVYRPGDRAVAVDTPWARLGLAICYDLRFPDLFRTLSNSGATVFAVPAAFTVPSGKAHWHTLLRARAIEAGCFVIAAAQVGRHEDGRETFGHSLVVDPWGEVLLDMREQEGLGLVELDMARLTEVRGRIPALANRRPVPAQAELA